MTAMTKNLASLAIFGWTLGLLAQSSAFAQSDAEQLAFPSAPSIVESSTQSSDSGPPAPPQRFNAPQANANNNSHSTSSGNSHNQTSNPISNQNDFRSRSANSPQTPAKPNQQASSSNYNPSQSSKKLNNNAAAQTNYQANQNSSSDSVGPGRTLPSYQQSPKGNSSENSSAPTIFGLKAQRAQQNSTIEQSNASSSSRNGLPTYMSPNYPASRNMQASMQTSSTPSSVMSSNNSSGNVTYGGAVPGAVVTGQMQAPMPKLQVTQTMPGMTHPPIVTPNAVYLDSGETIGPGKPRSGSRMMFSSAANTSPSTSVMQSAPPSMTPAGETIGPGAMMGSESMMPSDVPMEGDPMMGHSSDGFTNPYCNSCNGCGSCGYGGSWHGPTCGSCMNGNCGGCNEGCCDCDGGGSCGEHEPYGRPWIMAPFDWFNSEVNSCHNGWWWGEDLTVFAGVHDFKNIADGGLLSSFGFQEGVNWGVPLLPDLGLTGQIGYEGTQSEFENIDGSRLQSFVTAGVFHRPYCDHGVDAGVVFDWLHDDFFSDSFDICQVRGQVGWQWNRCNEFGFWFSTGVVNDSGFETLDQYNFFYRRQFCGGGDVRFWGGFTGGNPGSFDGGIFGADFEAPLAKRWALDGGLNYFIPNAKAGNGGFSQESWNVGFNLVCYLGGTAQCSSPYRPLFNVADNGTLMTISR